MTKLALFVAVLIAAHGAAAQELPCGEPATIAYTVRWKPPVEVGLGVTAYSLTELQPGGWWSEPVLIGVPPLINGVYEDVIDGIRNDAETVIALVAAGPGGASHPSVPLTIPAVIRGACASPSAPRDVAASFVPPTPPPPPPSTWPTAASTGPPAGYTLRSCPNTTISASVDGCIFESGVYVTGANVVISNSIIRGKPTDNYGVSGPATGVTLRNVEVFGVFNGKCVYFANGGVTIEKSNLHDCEDAVHGHTIKMFDNYVHDITVGGGRHSDGLQTPNIGKLELRRNYFKINAGANSAVFLQHNYPGGWNDAVIDGNWLESGAAAYTIYVDTKNGLPCPTNVKFTNNTMIAGGQGLNSTPCAGAAGWVWTNNRSPNGTLLLP